MCLQKKPNARPDIKGLLNMPLINKRIMHYLKEEAFKEEFAHTILHN